MNEDLTPESRRRLRDAFAQSTAPPPELAARTAAALRSSLAPRPAGYSRAVLGAVAAVALILGGLVASQTLLRGGSAPIGQPAGSPSPAATNPSAVTPSPAPRLSPGTPAIQVVCTSSSGGQTTVMDPVARVSTGAHPGYDRLVFEFGGAVPDYQLSPAPGTTFTADPSGQTVTVEGSSGLRLRLNGIDWTGYSGPRDLRPELTNLREARLIGNFEGVMTWAIGLESSNCYRLTLLTSPARLVIDFSTG